MALLTSRKCMICSVFLTAGVVFFPAVPPIQAEQTDSLQTLYNNLGVIQALNGNTEEARDYLDSARAVGSDDAGVLSNYANCLLCLGETERAIALYDSAFTLSGADQRIQFNWSLALYVIGRVDDSVEKMREFLVSQPFGEDEDSFISEALQGLPVSKAEAAKLSKEEIRQLLQKAKVRRDTALAKRAVADSLRTSADSLQDSTSDSSHLADSVRTKKTQKHLKVTPAGEKSNEGSQMARLLYWEIM